LIPRSFKNSTESPKPLSTTTILPSLSQLDMSSAWWNNSTPYSTVS
jgi:hypothetical protein